MTELSGSVRETYRFHRLAEAFRMFSAGVLGLADVVLKKSLGGSDLAVTIFLEAILASYLFAGLWGVLMEGRKKRPFFVFSAIVSRLWLVLLLVSTSPAWFIAVFAVATLAESCFLIAQSSLYQTNYPAAIRGQLVSRVSAIGRVTLLGGAILGGYLLDAYASRGHWVLAGGALVGFVGVLIYSRIPTPPAANTSILRPRRSFVHSLREIARVFTENPAFRRYERNFFIYGLAFMILHPIHVFLLVETFEASYNQISFLRLVLPQIGLMAIFPLAGRMLDRKGPYRTASIAFGSIAIYPILLLAASQLRDVRILGFAFIWFGGSLAMIDVVWNLSSLHFSRGRDNSPFMGVHVLLVGVRGMIGPLAGFALYRAGGYPAAFAASTALFLLASALMRWSRDRRVEEAAR